MSEGHSPIVDTTSVVSSGVCVSQSMGKVMNPVLCILIVLFFTRRSVAFGKIAMDFFLEAWIMVVSNSKAVVVAFGC